MLEGGCGKSPAAHEAKGETLQPEAIRSWPDVSVPSSLTYYRGRSLCPVFPKVWLVDPNNLRLL